MWLANAYFAALHRPFITSLRLWTQLGFIKKKGKPLLHLSRLTSLRWTSCLLGRTNTVLREGERFNGLAIARACQISVTGFVRNRSILVSTAGVTRTWYKIVLNTWIWQTQLENTKESDYFQSNIGAMLSDEWVPGSRWWTETKFIRLSQCSVWRRQWVVL